MGPCPSEYPSASLPEVAIRTIHKGSDAAVTLTFKPVSGGSAGKGRSGRLATYVLAAAIGGALVYGATMATGGDVAAGPVGTAVAAKQPIESMTPRVLPAKTDGGGAAALRLARTGDEPDLANLVEKLLPATVSIAVVNAGGGESRPEGPPRPGQNAPFEDYFRDYFERRSPPGGSRAVGSGFIIDPSGLVVTNNHVIDKASEVIVILHDETRLKATVVGKDERSDMALLKVESKNPLPTVTWGASAEMRVGDPVVAIGNPFGLGFTVTQGIISARKRHLRNFGGIPGSSFVDFLQTDAAINKGNSGGPLFNRRGEVIGINTAIYSQRGSNLGIAFAVPADLARPILDQLQKYGHTRRGWLGVQIQRVDEELAKALGLEKPSGALVANVVADGPAAKAGILSGDVILRFDGKPVEDQQMLPQLVAGTEVGKTVDVVVWRKKVEVTVRVELGELEQSTRGETAPDTGEDTPRGSGTAVLGMQLSTVTPELREQFDLNVASGVVVTGLAPDQDAAKKGVQPGDILLEVDLKPVSTPEDVATLVEEARNARKPGVLLLIQRGENRSFIAINFGEQ